MDGRTQDGPSSWEHGTAEGSGGARGDGHDAGVDEVGRLLHAAAGAWRDVGGWEGLVDLLATGGARGSARQGRDADDGTSRRSWPEPGPRPAAGGECDVCPVCVALRLWRDLVRGAASGSSPPGAGDGPATASRAAAAPAPVHHVPVVDDDARDGDGQG